ncbi:MAG: hypothetical protein R3D68_18240 [Hyphomicrobiaceae bacterium]
MRRWLHLLLLLSLGVVGAGQSRAGEPPTLLVVFDGSGSMWGKPDGWMQSKLAAAREGLRVALNDLPKDARLGLLSFGHRRGGDCSDVETILKPGPNAARQVMDLLEKHNPRGRGPITAALTEAARQLEGLRGAATVLLIHDDADNCQQDPCSALPLLQKAKRDVRIHVVSMTSRAGDARHMSCLTEPTGGLNAHVVRASEVVALLQKVVATPAPEPEAKAAAAPTPTRSPEPPKPQKAAVGLHLSARLGEAGPVVAEPVQWRILREGSDGGIIASALAARQSFRLPSGAYRIEGQLGLAKAEARVTVDESTAQALTLAFSAGYVRFTGQSGPSRALQNASIAIERLAPPDGPATAPVLVRGGASSMAMPAGDYRFSLATGTLRLERLARVSVGQVTPLTPPIDLGELVLNAAAAQGAGPLADATFTVYQDDPDAAGGRREIVHAAGTDASVVLPAGAYAVVARANGVETLERTQVKTGERTRHAITLGSGDLTVSVSLPKGLAADVPIAIDVRRQGAPGAGRTLHRSPASAVLQAGPYVLEARAGGQNAAIAQEIQIKAGTRVAVALTVPAGRLSLRARSGGTRAPLPDVTWEVTDAAGGARFAAPEAQPHLLLKPGTYAVTLHHKGRVWARDVSVTAGEVTAIDLIVP